LNDLLSFDVDGYPTDECLDSIRHYEGKWQELMENIAPAFHGYGRCEQRDDGVWEVATGGWSGNESIISALQDNYIFWAICWRLSKRGGYFEFETW